MSGSRPIEPGRSLSTEERELLDVFLEHEFEAADVLRARSANLRAAKGCGCGCGTIDFVTSHGESVARMLESTHGPGVSLPLSMEGTVVDADGCAIGGLLLFVRDGWPVSLEVYSSGHEPLALPTLDRVRWIEPTDHSS